MPKVFLEFLTLFISSCKGGVVLLSVYRNLFITTLILMQYALILHLYYCLVMLGQSFVHIIFLYVGVILLA